MMDKYKKEQQEKSILAAQLPEQLTHSQKSIMTSTSGFFLKAIPMKG